MTPTKSAPTGATPDRPRAAERRAARRFPLLQKCLARPEGSSGLADWHGIVYNLSTSGVGLSLPYPVPPGTILIIEPWDLPAPALRACVVRSALVAFAWFHGCALTHPLNDDELQSWLK